MYIVLNDNTSDTYGPFSTEKEAKDFRKEIVHLAVSDSEYYSYNLVVEQVFNPDVLRKFLT